MCDVSVRVAALEDAGEILGIYSHYVKNTAVTFEYEVPGLVEFTDRMKKTLEVYPYLAAVCGGEIIGYAYTGRFHAREAYKWSVETTVYIKNEKTGLGVGKMLYRALESVSVAQHIQNMNACIAFPDNDDEYLTHNSVLFHEHMGYSASGELHKCGYKFGRWYNVVFMEKLVGEHSEHPLPVLPFSELDMKFVL